MQDSSLRLELGQWELKYEMPNIYDEQRSTFDSMGKSDALFESRNTNGLAFMINRYLFEPTLPKDCKDNWNYCLMIKETE